MQPVGDRPMGKVVGRQPEILQIIPSKPNPWYGTIVDGEPLTLEQLRTLDRMSLDPTNTKRVTVRRNATDWEMWWPIGNLPPVYEFECPLLRRRADDRLHVIAPDGTGKLVFADGWTTPRRGRWKRGRA